MTIQQHASFDSSAAELNATSKLVKAWESKNAKNAAKAGGISLMALSLAACGGSSTTTAVTPVITQAELDAANAAAAAAAVAQAAAEAAQAAAEAELAAATATPAGTTIALATTNDVATGGAGNDTITATDTTYTANDVIVGGEGTDTLTITAAAEASITAVASVSGVETVNVVLNGFTADTVDMANVVGAAVTVTQAQLAGATDVTVNNLSTTSSLTLGSTFTGTLTMTGQGTVNAVDAATVTATLGAAAGSVTINGDDSTNTVNLVAATAVAGTTTDAAVLNLAGTVAVDNENAANTVVENLTLSGNGAAASYDIADATTAANTLETLTVTGDQNVTITASAAALGGIDAAADYSDTSTAGTTTVVMDTRATVDLTHVKADLIEFGTAGAAMTITTANGQALGLTADASTGAGALTVDSTELTTGDETLNLTIEANQTTAIVVSDFEVVNLTIDDGSAATTTAQTITVGGLTGGASTDINISSTLDNLTLTAVTADNLIATNFAGVLTLSGSTGIDNVTGGSGNDVITHSADTNFTLAGGAGNDSLSVTNALTSRTVTYDGGAGTDTLEINNVLGVADRLTMSNIEIVDFNNRAGTHDARDFSGQTLVATSTGGTNTSVTMSIANATNVDLSGITGDEAQLDFTVGATATAIATTFSGTQIKDTITTGAGDDTINGNGGADIIDGAAGADTINGGAGADSITGGAGNDALTGGAGSDTFNFSQTAALNGSDTVSDFTVGTVASGGDVINGLGDIATMAVSNATSGTSITLATATALATEGTSIAVADETAYFAKVASTSTIDTVAELVTALTNGGELDAVDFAANADALLILSEDNGSTLFVYGVDNDGTAAIVAGELALLATITSSADVLDNFTTANIA